jgi:hypothetical protein
MVSLEVIAILLSGIGISASLFYYSNVLQNANKTRQAQLFMDLYRTYRDPVFRKQYMDILNMKSTDFNDWWEKYGQENNVEAWTTYQTVASYFNGIGVLLKQGLIDIEMIEELLAPTVFMAWMRMGHVAEGFRDLSASKSFRALADDIEGNGRPKKKDWLPWSGFKYLNDELRKRDLQKS